MFVLGFAKVIQEAYKGNIEIAKISDFVQTQLLQSFNMRMQEC